MSSKHDTSDLLKITAAKLYSDADRLQLLTKAKIGALDLLIHDAEAREHRRAEFNARDKACYRLGGAFEPVGGLCLDPVALSGFLALGSVAVLLLAQVALALPDEPVADNLARLFRSPAGRVVRAHGVWVRWRWLRELYLEETERFLRSKKGRDPKARWRAEQPTSNQTYLIAEICLDLELELQRFATRGQAFDWIRGHGGNPRFTREPARPDLSSLAAMLR